MRSSRGCRDRPPFQGHRDGVGFKRYVGLRVIPKDSNLVGSGAYSVVGFLMLDAATSSRSSELGRR